jgi:hypothetical protein
MDPSGLSTRFGPIAFCRRHLLVRHGHRHMVRDALRVGTSVGQSVPDVTVSEAFRASYHRGVSHDLFRCVCHVEPFGRRQRIILSIAEDIADCLCRLLCCSS